MRSRDAGETWENLKDNIEFDLHYIYTMPDDPSIVLATSGHGLFRSFEGGDTWEERKEGLDFHYFAPLAFHSSRPQVLFTAAASTPPPGWRRPDSDAESAFYRSANRGDSWERLSGGLPEHLPAAPRALASDPEDPDSFFIGMTTGSVWMTEDAGESFQEVLSGLPQVGLLNGISVLSRTRRTVDDPADAGRAPAQLFALAAKPPEEIASLTVPTLCIVGEQDGIGSPEVQINLVRRLAPNWQLETVAEAGHSVYFERAGVFNSLVDDFLDKLR